MYDLEELEAFVSVVRTGSLTASTRDLGCPKSTLSRRIRQLEEAVGQPLLLRQSRKVVPNDAGRVFYRYSNDILELAARGREALDELKEEVSGQLELRCNESLVRGWFAGVVEAFMDEYPDMRVALHTQQRVPEKLDNGICLWLGAAPECPLRQERLGLLAQSVYASPGYLEQAGLPATPGELGRYAWVDMLNRHGGGTVLHNSAQGTYPLSAPERQFTVDQFCVQGDAIAAGRGLGLMPDWLVEQRMRAHPGSFRRCLPDWRGPDLPVTLLYPHGHLPRRVRAFITHLRNAVPMAWLAGRGVAEGVVPETGTDHINT